MPAGLTNIQRLAFAHLSQTFLDSATAVVINSSACHPSSRARKASSSLLFPEQSILPRAPACPSQDIISILALVCGPGTQPPAPTPADDHIASSFPPPAELMSSCLSAGLPETADVILDPISRKPHCILDVPLSPHHEAGIPLPVTTDHPLLNSACLQTRQQDVNSRHTDSLNSGA